MKHDLHIRPLEFIGRQFEQPGIAEVEFHDDPDCSDPKICQEVHELLAVYAHRHGMSIADCIRMNPKEHGYLSINNYKPMAWYPHRHNGDSGVMQSLYAPEERKVNTLIVGEKEFAQAVFGVLSDEPALWEKFAKWNPNYPRVFRETRDRIRDILHDIGPERASDAQDKQLQFAAMQIQYSIKEIGEQKCADLVRAINLRVQTMKHVTIAWPAERLALHSETLRHARAMSATTAMTESPGLNYKDIDVTPEMVERWSRKETAMARAIAASPSKKRASPEGTGPARFVVTRNQG